MKLFALCIGDIYDYYELFLLSILFLIHVHAYKYSFSYMHYSYESS